MIKEGVASFISEALVMQRTHKTASRAAAYATENEKALWLAMKGELCTADLQHWLFNGAFSKDRLGELGYRMGYKIARSYYDRAPDK